MNEPKWIPDSRLHFKLVFEGGSELFMENEQGARATALEWIKKNPGKVVKMYELRWMEHSSFCRP